MVGVVVWCVGRGLDSSAVPLIPQYYRVRLGIRVRRRAICCRFAGALLDALRTTAGNPRAPVLAVPSNAGYLRFSDLETSAVVVGTQAGAIAYDPAGESLTSFESVVPAAASADSFAAIAGASKAGSAPVASRMLSRFAAWSTSNSLVVVSI